MNNYFMKSIGCFTADYRNKKVIVGNVVFPAGYYFMNSLNEYWKDAPDGYYSNPKGDWLIANRLLIEHFDKVNIHNGIIAGRLDENSADKIHKSIMYIFNIIKRAKPFRYLDINYEKDRCDVLFGIESVRQINNFLLKRSQYVLQDDFINLPDIYEIN